MRVEERAREGGVMTKGDVRGMADHKQGVCAAAKAGRARRKSFPELSEEHSINDPSQTPDLQDSKTINVFRFKPLSL